MSGVKIPLYPESLFGYYLQLAALGIGGWKGEIREGWVEIEPQDYVDLLKRAVETVVFLKTGSRLDYEEITPDVCQKQQRSRITAGPRFYRVGNKIDRSILKNVLTKEVGSWCEATLRYVDMVVKAGGPLIRPCESLALFWYPTMYGEARGVGPRDVVNVDSVGLGLVGGLASFLGSIRIGDSEYEYFVVPDGSPQSIEDMAGVLEALYGPATAIGDFIGKLAVFMNLETGISADLATFFTSILQVSSAIEVKEDLVDLVQGMSFDRYLLVRNSVAQRPQIMWVTPLTISHIVDVVKKRGAVDFLRRLYWLAVRLGKVQHGDKSFGQQAMAAVGECINSTMLYFWSGQVDFVVNCVRNLALLGDRASGDFLEIIGRTISQAERLVRRE